MEHAIVVKNLKKDYKVKKKIVNALKSCSFEIETGKSIGFVGLNGAGKSTTIKILTGIMQATGGSVKLLGVDPFVNRKKLMSQIGVLFGQRSNLIYDLPVKDSFKLLKAVYSISDEAYEKQIDFIKKYIEFEPLLDTPVRQMSLGQRMRCEVASVLLHNPKVVFLDEAFLGIDFKSKTMIRKLLDAMREQNGTTFFITSHDIRDIERMCDDVIIINQGEIIAHDNIYNIEKQSKWVHLNVTFYEEIDTTFEVGQDAEVEQIDAEENSVRLKTKRDSYKAVLDMVSQKYEVASYEVADYNLEEIIGSIYEEMNQKNE